MQRVFLSQAISYNVTGYDREETAFAAGELLVPDRVAEYVSRNPEVGRLLDVVLALTLEAKNLTELKAYAAEQGIDLGAARTKPDIIAAIRGAATPSA